MIVRRSAQTPQLLIRAITWLHFLIVVYGWTNPQSRHCSWRQTRLWKALPQRNEDASSNDASVVPQVPRREFLFSTLIAPIVASARTASARGLVQFPCQTPLANSYHFLRVGTTLLEEEGIWSTNPLFLTNRDDALSPTGIEQVVAACRRMQQDEALLPTLVKYSLAASCIDTATIVGQELKLGTDRLVPEFTFLDPRAIGDWDMSARNLTLPAVWAMDRDEAGRDGLQGRPPASDDSTPNEVLADQAVRLRQVMSILESQYSGDTILLIFPDGTGPAILSAMIAGIPYNRAHEIEFQPGEIRFDVTMESTLALWKSKQLLEGESYNEILKEGRATLKELRATQMRGGTVANLKDQKIEEERIAIETEYRRKERRRLDAERKEYEQRRKRQREIVLQRGNSTGSDVFSPIPVALASAGAVGAAFWRFGPSRETETTVSALAPSSEKVDMPGKDDATTNNNTGFTNVTLNMTLSTPPVLDPSEKARIAMEEYMNRDDGADDWILSLSQILKEDEDETNTESDANVSDPPNTRRGKEMTGYISELQNLTANGAKLSRAIGDELSLKVNNYALKSDNEEAFQ